MTMTAQKQEQAHTADLLAPWHVEQHDGEFYLMLKSGGIIAKFIHTNETMRSTVAAAPETARERDELRAEVSRLQGILNKLQLGEEPTRKQHRSSLDQRAEKAEAQRDELLELVKAFKSYLEDNSQSPRRRQACLDGCNAALAATEPAYA